MRGMEIPAIINKKYWNDSCEVTFHKGFPSVDPSDKGMPIIWVIIEGASEVSL